MPLTYDRAHELFLYNPKTGSLKWRVNRPRVRIGDEVGSGPAEGPLRVKVQGENYLVHRVIWLLKTGCWPKCEIDHKDTNKMNNRWKNLRDVPGVVNRQNQRVHRADSTTGFLGVGHIYNGRFRARITVAGKQRLIGCFGTAEEAHAAYLKEKRKHHIGCTL